MRISKEKSVELFRNYMVLTGVSSLGFDEPEEAFLQNKKLGIVNGSSWVTLWSTYFGNQILPGVKLINIGNEAQQLNFMKAHAEGRECPPAENIVKTCQYAKDLCEMCKPDAILLTCSTMNRAYPYVQEAISAYDVPLVQIDAPMMEKAVQIGTDILIIATHGPSVNSTRALLEETAERQSAGKEIRYFGETVETAFDLLGKGDIAGHNRTIEAVIRRAQKERAIDCVVLAQLSMSIFYTEYPDPEAEFGIPVLCSGIEGFQRIKDIFRQQSVDG